MSKKQNNMGNANTKVFLRHVVIKTQLLQTYHCEREVAVRVGSNGTIPADDLKKVKGMLDGFRGEEMQDLTLTLLQSVHDADAGFAENPAALDNVLLQVHAAGLARGRGRPCRVRIVTNVRDSDMRYAALALHCVLRECGMRHIVGNARQNLFISDNALFSTDVGGRWPQPVTIKVEAALRVAEFDGAVPVFPCPMYFSGTDLMNPQPDDTVVRLLTMLSRQAPETEYTVTVLFDALVTEAMEGRYRKAVFFYANTPLQHRLAALVNRPPVRGVLRRAAALIPLADVYRVRIVTNACGPHMGQFVNFVSAAVAAIGGFFCGVELLDDDLEKKTKH